MPTTTSFSDYPQEQATNVSPLVRSSAPASIAGSAPTGNTTNSPNDPNNPDLAKQQQEESRQEAENKYVYDILFDWNQAKIRMMKLRSVWMHEINATIERRLYRKVDISPKRLRDDGKLKPDETIIPMRVIDTNIAREAPSYINYLISPNRMAIFHCMDNPSVDSQTTQNIEKDFTQGLRYPGWEIPYIKTIDGAQDHGWDFVEVVYDPTKPLGVGIEHVGHDNYWFSVDSIDLQANELGMRRFSVSAMQLRGWITKFGFDPHQTQMCLDVIKGIDRADFNFTVYKVLFKWQDVVYVAWGCLEFCDDWLKKPEKLKLGISKQVPVTKQVTVPNPKYNILTSIGSTLGLTSPEPPTITMPQTTLEWQEQDVVDYPIFINIYKLTEELPIMMAIGRGFLDKYKQEAMTAIATGYVNGLNRASNIYGSVQGDPTSSAEPVQLKTALNNGAIYDRKIEFFATPYPDPQCLQSLEYFGVQNTEETGQVNFAAQNRADSRKTAKEISAAEQSQQQLSTVQVALFSIFMLKVLNFCWLIVQSQALQNKIKMLQVPIPQLNPDGSNGYQMVNNNDLLKLNYLLRPAGSVDVIERQQTLTQMRQDWSVMQQSPLAVEFFKEFVRCAYPNMANSWIAILDQNQSTKQLVQTLASMLMHFVQKDAATISPQDKQTLMQLQQQVQQFLQPQTSSQVGATAPAQFGQQSQQTPTPDANRQAGVEFQYK